MEVSNFSIYSSAGQSLFWNEDSLNNLRIPYSNTYQDLLVKMKHCFQYSTIDMYEHGLMVNREYTNLIMSLEQGLISEVFPVQLIDLYKNNSLIDFNTTLLYHVLHDCGKPLCKKVDEKQLVHYPNHAEISFNQIKILYPKDLDLQFLIKHDMDFHTLSTKDLEQLAKTKYGFTLYLTAWSELIANASLFNGFDSVSFKIKRKKLIKCLKLFKH